jgi:hypothetical protein
LKKFDITLVFEKNAENCRNSQKIVIITSTPGLTDFSWYNMPKRGKIYQLTTKLPIAHLINPVVVKDSKWPYYTYDNIFLSKVLQNIPNWDFWSEKKPSGSPAPNTTFGDSWKLHLSKQYVHTKIFNGLCFGRIKSIKIF